MTHDAGPPYTASMGPEPYPKLTLSSTPNYAPSEHTEMPMQQASMPPLPLSLAASQDHQQAPIRTQYANYGAGAPPPPPQLSLAPPPPTTSADHHASSLSVPRYVDSNPRPSKSPRHSSLSTDPSSDYRYGPPPPRAPPPLQTYAHAPVSNSSDNLSPHSLPPPRPYAAAPTTPTTESSSMMQQQHHTSRDHHPFPSWAATGAGEPVQIKYENVSYGPGPESEGIRSSYSSLPLPPPPQHPAGMYTGSAAMAQYTWPAS
jgi:hypothetical protein